MLSLLGKQAYTTAGHQGETQSSFWLLILTLVKSNFNLSYTWLCSQEQTFLQSH